MGPKKVIKEIKSYSKFIITSHIDLEGDALGSELALASLLKKLGKKAIIINADRTPVNYTFLPGVKKIRHKLNRANFQAVVIVDCPNKKRVGRILRFIDNEKPIINIDHHLDNKNFGKINWVDTDASSGGEMIYRLFKVAKIKLDKKDALNIYTAILTDTGSFRHCNTQANAFRIASKLLKFGLNPAEIYTQIYEHNSAQDVMLIANILSRISFAVNNKIAWAKIDRLEFKKIKKSPEILDRILDFVKSISVVKIVIVFCQVDQQSVKLSFRSKRPINVQRMAKAFGGGGHKFASGCTIKGDLKEVEKKVLTRIKSLILRTNNPN